MFADRRAVPAIGAMVAISFLAASACPWVALAESGSHQTESAVVAAIESISPSVIRIEAMRRGGLSNGCGTIIDSGGLVLTCRHVVAGSRQIDAILSDGRRARAEIIGSDTRTDLAVIRLSVTGLKAAVWGDAEILTRGCMVIALGSPAGLVASSQPSAAAGYVTAIGRPDPSAFGVDGADRRGVLLQTSAMIRRGDSGGPLVDLDGKLVGVVSAMVSDGTTGLAPALAIPLGGGTRRLVSRLARGEEIERGDIGLRTGPSRLDARLLSGSGGAPGLIVSAVEPGGPAEQAGLRLGDVILRADGKVVASSDELEERVGEAPPGSRLAILIRREGIELAPLSILVRREPSAARPHAHPAEGREWRGARLSPLPESLWRQMAVPSGSLMVVRVASDSAAARAGLEPGSVIVRIGGRTLDSPESSSQSIDDAGGDVVLGLASGATKLVRGN